ncbi:MAG TPA: hypothetical protein VGU03_11135 [Frateuria sp.]|uniref:hypothetical protein n=1 Tax=Frateuria sp. TaxID=2211372 RepID=UPI002DE5D834|nr:hypothetical protein [Frateuria sp.]
MSALLQQLEELAIDWDEQARDRHSEGLAASADAYRSCRDDLRRLIKQAKKEAMAA